MPHRYLLAAALGVALPAAAQTEVALPAAPAPGDTLLVQGQRQPARAFFTIQDQLRTVAGVQVTPFDGTPGAGQVVRIRGASLLAGPGQPLYVVDGLPALNDELSANLLLGTSLVPSPSAFGQYNTVAEQGAEAGANPLQLLPPESIASIEVLAGPAAVARYGPLAANGVVSIRTRPLAGSRRDSLRWRVGYAAYGGVQQVRHRYDLLDATDFATIVNEAAGNYNAPTYPFPNIALGTGTDWQAETYRLAGLQQHQLSVAGQGRRTGVLASIDYRQQAGVLRNSSLTRYGLRLGLDHRATERLTLRASVALGETDQRLPYTAGPGGAGQAALLAPPTEGVRTAQGTYAGYGQLVSSFQPSRFTNPVAVAELSYREPRTHRLLAQLGADYRLGTDLTVQLTGNYQRTDLAADGYNPVAGATYYAPPTGSQRFAYQTYQAHQVAGRLAVRYQHRFGRHLLGAEVDYQYQQVNYQTRVEYNYGGLDAPSQPVQPVGRGYYGYSSRPRLHRPWAGLRYALADSLLTVEAGLSYAHFRDDNHTEYYPNAQVSYQPRLVLPAALPLTVWVGAGRTGLFGYGYGFFGPASLVGSGGPFGNSSRQLAPFYTDQLEAGLRLGGAGGRFSAQLVGYGRRSRHLALPTVVAVISGSSIDYLTLYDEGTVRNLGLELTLTGTWQAGPLAGTTRLVASANRNRVRNDEDGIGLDPAYDNHPVAAFYGYQPQGLTSTGTPRYRDANGDGTVNSRDRQYLGSIPAELLSLSQQLRRGRWALDVQLDALLDYQVLNQQLMALDLPSGLTNNAPTVLDRWTPTHTDTSIPVAGYRQYSVGPFDRDYAARLLESGNQLRLSALTLSYALRPAGRPGLSVWVSTQNLFVLSSYRGYDPNVSSGGSLNLTAGQDYGAVPVPRAFLLGVRAAL